VFTEAFPPEEFAARRAAVINAIGDAVAIIQGAVEKPAELPFRQSAQFYYLTGVEVPRAILVIDGRAKSSTLYIDPAGYRVRALGPSLGVSPEAAKSPASMLLLRGISSRRPCRRSAATTAGAMWPPAPTWWAADRAPRRTVWKRRPAGTRGMAGSHGTTPSSLSCARPPANRN
jgi:hypothetical protein